MSIFQNSSKSYPNANNEASTTLIKLLGDNLTGRRTLISKIINDDKDPYRGHGLSYEYINITGKDEEECGCLSFITVDPSAPIRAQERVCTSFISPQTIKWGAPSRWIMVVVSILSHSESRPNDHRQDASLFIILGVSTLDCIIWSLFDTH